MSDIENEEDDIIKPINLNLQFSKMRRSSRIGAQSTKTALPTSRRRIAKGIRTETHITSSKRKLSDITNTSQQMPRRGPEKGILFPKGKRFKKATPTPSPTKSSLSFGSSSSLASSSVSTSLRTKNDQGKIKTLQDKDKSEGSTKGDSRIIHSKKHLPTQSNTKRTSLPTVSHRDEGYLKSTASAKGKMRTKVVNMDNQTETNSRPSSTMTSKKTRLSLTETKNLQNEKKDLLNEKKDFKASKTKHINISNKVNGNDNQKPIESDGKRTSIGMQTRKTSKRARKVPKKV